MNHAHGCSHRRGNDHEVVGGTTTTTEEEDDEEPEEKAAAQLTLGDGVGEVQGGVELGGAACLVGLAGMRGGLVLEGTDVGGSCEAGVPDLFGLTSSVRGLEVARPPRRCQGKAVGVGLFLVCRVAGSVTSDWLPVVDGLVPGPGLADNVVSRPSELELLVFGDVCKSPRLLNRSLGDVVGFPGGLDVSVLGGASSLVELGATDVTFLSGRFLGSLGDNGGQDCSEEFHKQ